MKKFLSGLLVASYLISYTPNAFAALTDPVLAASTDWANAGTRTDATTLTANSANGLDDVTLGANTLTFTNDGVNDDAGNFNSFSAGTLSSTTTGGVTTTTGANANNAVSITAISLTGAGAVLVTERDADTGNNATTVTGALSTGGTVTLTNNETSSADTVGLTVGGNYTATGATTVNGGAFAGANSTLTLNGATNTGTGGFVLNTATGIATMTVGGTATATTVTGTINGAAANEGVLNITGDGTATDTTTFASVIGGTQILNDINVGTAGATTAAFSGAVSATNLDIQNASNATFAGTYTGVLDFESLGTATFANGANIVGAVTENGSNNTGTLIFSGTSSASTTIGVSAADDLLLLRNSGTGTVTLNGNTFAETTNFAADGTIALASGVNLSSAAITATTTSNGTITTAGASTIGRAAGTIGATGARLKQLTTATATTTTVTGASAFIDATTITGTGTLAVTGALDWTGTTINFAGNGVMTATADSDITANITNSTTNNGTLTLADGAHTIIGNLGSTGVGLLAVNIGTGTTALTGDILATQVNFTAGGGTLTLADGSDLTIGASHFTTAANNAGVLTFLTGSHSTSGAGTIGVIGTALNAVNVNNGANVTLGNNLAATTTTIATGGTMTLSGTRTVTGDITQVGTGTLGLGTTSNIHTGILTTAATSIINTTLNSSTVFGNLTSSGVAVIAAGTTVNATVAGLLTSGTALVIVNGANGATTAISVTDNSPRYSFTGLHLAADGNVTITPTLNSLGSVTGANNTGVATVLDASAAGATGDFLTVQNALSALNTDASFNAAVDQLDPEVNAGVMGASFTALNQSVGTVLGRLDNIRTANSPTGVSTGDWFTGIDAWIKGFGTYADQDTRSGVNGYEAGILGTALGFDGAVNETCRLGIAGGYAYSDVDSTGSNNNTEIDSYQATLYGSHEPEESPWFFNAALSYAFNNYDSTRHINFGTVSRIATGDYDGNQFSGYADANYGIQSGEFMITPIASLQYVHLDLDGYTETGADSLNLIVAGQDYDFLQSGLGVKVSREYKNENGTYIPQIHAKWLYDFIGDEQSTTSTFSGGGASFNTVGAEPAQHSFNVGAGLTFISKGSMSLDLTYDLEVKEDFYGHTGVLTARFAY